MTPEEALKKAQEMFGSDAYVIRMMTRDGEKFVVFDERDTTRGFSSDSFEDMFEDAIKNKSMYGNEKISEVN